jgi:Outer membrane lipoprotein-sorting protein
MSMVERGIAAVMCVMLLAGCALAQPKDNHAKASPKKTPVDLVLDNMEIARKGLKTFTAHVKKTTTTVPLDDIQNFEGEIKFKMPRFLFLVLKSKDTKLTTRYIVGKEYGYIHRVEDKQVEGALLKDIDEKKRDKNPLQYGLASNVHAFKKSYNLKLLKDAKVGEEDTVVLQMMPKGADPDLEDGKVTLWLSKKTWLIHKVEEVKNDGDVIEAYTFSKIKTNLDIPDKLFNWKPGKDLEVKIMVLD